MTAPAVAATSGPIAPAAPRPSPASGRRPARLWGRARLLPGASAKADASTAEEPPGLSNEDILAWTDGPSFAARRRRALRGFAVALRVASTMDGRQHGADNSPSLASPPMKGAESEDSGASIAAGANAGTVGRLVGERAFHFGASTFAGAIASRALGVNAPFAPGPPPTLRPDRSQRRKRNRRQLFHRPGDAGESLGGYRSTDCECGVPDADRLSHGRVPAHRASPHEQPPTSRPQRQSPTSRRRRLSPGSRPRRGPRASGIERQGGRRPAARSDPLRRAASSANRPVRRAAVRAFRRRGAAPTRRLDLQRPTRRRLAARERAWPWVSALDAAGPRDRCRSFAGGLEDVSMTMRLAGDKLSVVIRAASSHTLGTIEGARDAIADRMAAIGQPLDSLVFKQTGVNTDGNANGNGSSADGGSSGGEQRSAQGSDSNDAHSRRGAGRDRSF